MVAPDPRARHAANWLVIRTFADEPDLAKARADLSAHIAALDDPAFAFFRETFIFVYAPRFARSGLAGITAEQLSAAK